MIGPNSIHPQVQVVAQTMIHLLRTSQKKLGPAVQESIVESVDAAAKEKETGTKKKGYCGMMKIVAEWMIFCSTFLPANLHWISQYWLAGWYPRGFVLFPRTEASRLSP
ncbi:hypothetical protein POTOM_036728 [Populus tomentosa]|uniref:Uncharacterized protein n=1 Tax=Populus tomentosa TaxID=118781 RepID=A0A8X8CNE3_POPTO|nr:hypothetical protein POTOM_036728 [Populus tomentosa]